LLVAAILPHVPKEFTVSYDHEYGTVQKTIERALFWNLHERTEENHKKTSKHVCPDYKSEELLTTWVKGCAIAQAVASFPPWQIGVEPRSGLVGFVVDIETRGQVFSEYFSFPLPFILTTAPHISFINLGWYNMPNSDQCVKCTQSHPTSRN
jgi:hypothetical protein